tara:strand:+ start:984 stop:1979 length:996 start_codon:yes stop_codon:yes gene_type:complete
MKNINIFIIIFLLLSSSISFSDDGSFNDWKISFKKYALAQNISEETFNKVMKNARFLPKVIEYDRYQPEFYEDTNTYVSKRASDNKLKKGLNFYNKNKILINKIEKEFKVEQELLLALMGIETNYGTYVGKMDIISSLATLSFDKRRTEFFTNELITILKLVDEGIVDYKILYGSWAGAFGNFQFMPSTIERYAIDYNKNNLIELKNTHDSFASAANYLKKIGWKKNKPCFLKVDLDNNIPKKYLNTSAKKIKNKKKLKFFKKYLVNYDESIDGNPTVGIITPDFEIVKNPNKYEPAYIVFENYELILKWNRSLRFALAVCTLKEKFKNEI